MLNLNLENGTQTNTSHGTQLIADFDPYSIDSQSNDNLAAQPPPPPSQPLNRVHFISTQDVLDRAQDENVLPTSSSPTPQSTSRTHSRSLNSLASVSSASSTTSGFSTNNEATIPADYKHACLRPSVIQNNGDNDQPKGGFLLAVASLEKQVSCKSLLDKLKSKRLEKSQKDNSLPKLEVAVRVEKEEKNDDNNNDDDDDDTPSTEKRSVNGTRRAVRRFKGIGFTLISSFFFSLTTVIVKGVKDVSAAELALFRFVGIFLMALPIAWEQNTNIFGASDMRIFLILRGIAGATSLFCRYSALSFMSLADTTIIILSMPVFVFIFARIFLKEPFGRFHIVALVLSIVGIVFASKLDVLFGEESSDNGTTTPMPSVDNMTTSFMGNLTTSFMGNLTSSTPFNVSTAGELSKTKKQLYGTLFSVGSMVIGSFVYVITRKVRATHYSVILLNFALVAMSEMTVVNFAFYRFALPLSGYTPWLVALLAIFSFYGQLFLTKAIQVEEAGVVSVIRVSGEALFAFIFQITIFKELPDVYTIVGAVLVMSSVFLLSFRKYIIGLPDDSSLKQRFKFLTR